MIIFLLILLFASPCSAATLLTESFDNRSLPNAAYATFDTSAFDSSTRVGSSGYSAKFTWSLHGEEPAGVNTATRYSFTSSDSVYISFYWRFNSDWVGSGQSYHPHLLIFTDELWANLAGGPLRVYIEPTGVSPRMIIGRGETTTWHETSFNSSLDTWYRVECWFSMNTVGQANGVMKMWIDGVSVYDNSAVTYRTDSNIHFAALSNGPWISTGDGGNSPQAQTMWMDTMIVTDEEPYKNPTAIGCTISGASLY